MSVQSAVKGCPIGLLSLCAILLIVMLMPNPSFSEETSLTMDSEAGDYIGRGLFYIYSLSDGKFTAQPNAGNGVSVSFTAPNYSHWWYLDFAAPNNALLTVGSYSGATRYPFQAVNAPGLSVYGDGSGCDTSTGSFEVKEINYGANNEIISFWATFEQHCGGRLPDPGLMGEIRFNATAPNSVTTLQTSSNPSAEGQTITFTARVAGSTVVPTGTVTFTDGMTVLGTSTLLGSPATATLSTSALSAQTHSITAKYSGDSYFEPSSASLTQTVENANATMLMMNISSSYATGNFIFYSLVDGTFSAQPLYGTGVSISFITPDNSHYWFLHFAAPNKAVLTVGTYSGATNMPGMNTPLLDVEGGGCDNLKGSFEVKEISYGANNEIISFWATFEQHCGNSLPDRALLGEIRFNATTAPNSVTSLQTSADTSAEGQTITFTARVAGSTVAPTGTVTFTDGMTVLGTLTLLGSPATATFSTSALSAGTHSITASYSGDSYFGPSFASLTQTVENTNATMLMMISSAGDPVGQGLFYFYSLADGTFAASPNYDNGVSVSFGTLGGSYWSLNFAAPNKALLTVGTYSGTTMYPFQDVNTPGLSVDGNSTGCSSTGSFEVKEVSYGANNEIISFWATFEQHCDNNLPPLTGEIRFNTSIPGISTSIISNLNPSEWGAPVTFTANIVAASGIPTGSVTFMDGSTVLGVSALSGSPATATFQTSSLSGGARTIRALYTGDTKFPSSLSDQLRQVVIIPPCSSNVIVSPSSSSFTPLGGTANITVSATNSCQWSAIANVDWITVSPGSGQGNGVVTVSIAPSQGNGSRSGIVTISGQTITITQHPCMYTFASQPAFFGQNGGSAFFIISADNTLCWNGVQGVSNNSWISVGYSYLDSSLTEMHIGYSVFANSSGVSRKGTITIAGQVFSILQSSSASPGGKWQDLGTLPGMQWFNVNGISLDGMTVVGDAIGSGDGYQFHAFRWDQTYGMVDLGLLPGGIYSSANAVSADGSVVVGGATASDSTTRAFKWTQGGGMVDIGLLPGWTDAEALAVSADGAVIVGAALDGAANTRAFRWTQSGGLIDLGVPPGYSAAAALAVSADGAIVSGLAPDNGGYVHAIQWSQSSSIADLGIVADTSTTFNSMSADGTTVVGGKWFSLVNYYAFRWTTVDGIVNLGGWGDNSEALGVSPDGTITVGSALDSSRFSSAFRWSATNGLQPLSQWLQANGVDISNSDFDVASAVSAKGNVIAGRLRNGHAYRAAVYEIVIDPSFATFPPNGGSKTVSVIFSNQSVSWTALSNVPWISITSGSSGTGNGTVQYSVAANTGGVRTGTITIAGQTLTVMQGTTLTNAQIGVFRAGVWYVDRDETFGWSGCGSDGCYVYGMVGDHAVTGDWDGTGIVRLGVFRNGMWYLDYNGDGQWSGCGTTADTDRCYAFGMMGDIPVVGDWNGNGVSKIGVFRNGMWYLDYAGTYAATGTWAGCGAPTDPTKAACIAYGTAGDIPVAGNWNGSSDGKSKIGVFRNGMWYLDYSGTYVSTGTWAGCGAPTDPTKASCITYGMAGDIPVVGDWNGSADGESKIGVFRNGTWYLDYPGTYAATSMWLGCGAPADGSKDACMPFGMNGDMPVVLR